MQGSAHALGHIKKLDILPACQAKAPMGVLTVPFKLTSPRVLSILMDVCLSSGCFLHNEDVPLKLTGHVQCFFVTIIQLFQHRPAGSHHLQPNRVLVQMQTCSNSLNKCLRDIIFDWNCSTQMSDESLRVLRVFPSAVTKL